MKKEIVNKLHEYNVSIIKLKIIIQNANSDMERIIDTRTNYLLDLLEENKK